MSTLLLVLAILGYFGCASGPATHNHRATASIETPQCSLACSQSQRCVNSFTEAGGQCVPVPLPAPLSDLTLPFDKNGEVICTHASGSGSHSGDNAFYALDLATAYDLPAAIVRASADGVAAVFLGEDGNLCPEPAGGPSSAQSSDCGNSWGNRILVLHPNGYASFYVHLDHPLVSNGTHVKKGDAIGVEGWTGAAGHRHLHWSLQQIPGVNEDEWSKHVSMGWVGQSVPFSFSARVNGKKEMLRVSEIRCAHAQVGGAPSTQQPRFSGVQ